MQHAICDKAGFNGLPTGAQRLSVSFHNSLFSEYVCTAPSPHVAEELTWYVGVQLTDTDPRLKNRIGLSFHISI